LIVRGSLSAFITTDEDLETILIDQHQHKEFLLNIIKTRSISVTSSYFFFCEIVFRVSSFKTATIKSIIFNLEFKAELTHFIRNESIL